MAVQRVLADADARRIAGLGDGLPAVGSGRAGPPTVSGPTSKRACGRSAMVILRRHRAAGAVHCTGHCNAMEMVSIPANKGCRSRVVGRISLAGCGPMRYQAMHVECRPSGRDDHGNSADRFLLPARKGEPSGTAFHPSADHLPGNILRYMTTGVSPTGRTAAPVAARPGKLLPCKRLDIRQYGIASFQARPTTTPLSEY